MKKIITLVLVILLVGCSSTKKEDNDTNNQTNNSTQKSSVVDLNSRANDFIKLLEIDGIKDMKVSEIKNNNIILKNKQCQIDITFKDNKVSYLKSSMIDNSNDDYSCVFRTIFQDKDLVGTDKNKLEDFMNKFRDNKEFTYDNLTIKNDFYNLEVEVK
ncbi:MAG: hypothetical protein LBR40_05100 [Bacilli bacterium]|jgi:PBP1b-binding outer membrane lipoprotein LpoB|nr:hypothetical protein [Bacilli bacterium]